MTYKDKVKQRVSDRARAKSCRERQKGVTQGVTEEPKGVTNFPGLIPRDRTDYPDILNKLTDKTWRKRLGMLDAVFKASHNPKYASDVTLGVIPPECYSLDVVFDYLECTR